MNRAGATSVYPTTEFGSGETEQVPYHPEERHIRIGVDVAFGAVDAKSGHQRALVHFILLFGLCYCQEMPLLPHGVSAAVIVAIDLCVAVLQTRHVLLIIDPQQ
jgi:hypothetical protein